MIAFMAKAILFGASSELGNALVDKLMERKIVSQSISVGRSRPAAGSMGFIQWTSNSAEQVSQAIDKIPLQRGDVVIIASGAISKLDTSSSFSKLSLLDVENLIWANYSLPLLILNRLSAKFASIQGGGTIIVFSSAAAHPPTDENLLYSWSKSALDSISVSLSKKLSLQGIQLKIVRSTFSATKMNRGRTPTPLGVTKAEVAEQVVNSLEKKSPKVWVPKLFFFVAFGISRVPGAAHLVRYVVQKSKER